MAMAPMKDERRAFSPCCWRDIGEEEGQGGREGTGRLWKGERREGSESDE